MKLIELLIGKKLILTTDLNTEVVLEIESVRDTSTSHTRVIVPGTPENDWYGLDETIYNHSFEVTFTNGAKKSFKSLDNLPIFE